MSCHAIRKWTFSGLVGTFLDLSITFLLLCASALAYFASAFLSLFGLDLPCSCNGFFRISNHCCLQSQLFDLPSQRISSVQCSLKSKFPFNSPLNCNLGKETNGEHESGGSEGEAASCIGDLAKMKEKGFVMGAMNSPDFKERRFPRRRSRNNLRRRKKTCVDNRKLTWVSSCKSLWSDVQTPQSASSPFSGLTEDINENYKEDVNFKCGKEGLLDIGSKRKFSQGFELSESVDENEPIELSGDQEGIDNDAKNTIRLLEQALEEEHAMRAVLYMELEKERSAAATAADEAMAMISRLQEEKALIEMESRQRQRIVEDRCAYDEEEMNILKEILVRREREKYFLEKEVEAYRQLIANEHTDGADMYGKEFTLYLSDDDSVVMMPQQQPQPQLQNKLTEEDDNKSSISEDRIESTTPPSYEEKESEGILIHDVHVIDDDKSFKQIDIEEKNKQVISSNSYTAKTAGHNPIIISSGLPPIGRTKSLRSSSSSSCDMRRKSMSSFDSERFRIGSEISWLREKLKFVQEGRGKLNFNKSNREREKAQLQILEDLTSQLREIRHLTEPGKAARRASLPPLTSHVTSKKRRWRSGPLLVQGSV